MKGLYFFGMLAVMAIFGFAACRTGSSSRSGAIDSTDIVIFDGSAGGFISGAAARVRTIADGREINLADFVTVTNDKVTVRWNSDDGNNGAFRFIVDIDQPAQASLRGYSKFKMDWSTGDVTEGNFNISLYFNGIRMLTNHVNAGTGTFDFIEDIPGWASGWGDAVVGNITGFEIYAGDPAFEGKELAITKIWFESDGRDLNDGEIDLSQPGKSEYDANPLITNMYCADPTAVEYNGRLYVYGTNDHQQYLYDKDGSNTYEQIKSLVMISTDDMVNWTYHGTINIGELAPWIIASWAPSIVSRIEEDGKTHFYLYFSNSGFGVGVITATSPTGPWTSPLTKSLIDGEHPSVNHQWTPFDPGVVIDKDGIGWLSFGAGEPGTKYMPGGSHIVRLGADMISLDSEVTKIPAPYHFEASELNYISDTYVYTYCNSWEPRTTWENRNVAPPTQCSMSYMTTKTPLDPDSWVYRGHYFKNPGDNGMEYSNNHTHLHKFNGQYYLFYHTLVLQKKYGVGGGFRSIFADIIEVNEDTLVISEAVPTLDGLEQIKSFDPGRVNPFAALVVSAGLAFEPYDDKGNMFVTSQTSGSWSMVRGVEFTGGAKMLTVRVKGEGSIEVRIDSRDSTPIGHIEVSSSDWNNVTVNLQSIDGKKDLFFTYDDGLSAYTWTLN